MTKDVFPFKVRPVAIAVIHLPPGPGTAASEPGARPDAEAELDRVRDEAARLRDAGFHALIVENYGDAPFLKESVEPHTVARLALAALVARREAGLPVGINALRNDAAAALGAAVASGGSFIRVNVHTGVMLTDQGLIEGRAGQTMRYRTALQSSVAVFADVHVKHAVPLAGADLVRDAEDAYYRGHAAALILSGPATSRAADPRSFTRIRKALPEAPLLVGSGVTAETLRSWWSLADGVIVSSSLRAGGRPAQPLDPERLDEFRRILTAETTV
jgi:membrane complex biogenesis BtpA family protein